MAKRKIHLKYKARRKPAAQNKKGKAPGTIMYVGERHGEPSKLKVMEYNPDDFQELEVRDVKALETLGAGTKNRWIDVVGISDEKFIEDLGKVFNINSLALEDAINTHQRPKVDEYDDYIFAVFKMLYFSKDHTVIDEHVALVLFKDKVLVLQELKEDVFEGVRVRIRNKSGRIRTRGADYLFFALIDSIVDSYMEVVDHYLERIDSLEEEVYKNPVNVTALRIQDLKKEIIQIHKYIHPAREIVSRLIETESDLITRDTKVFLRDAQDHCIEVNENLQLYRELAMNLMEMYMSNVSNKMNEVMKVLTIMASIFIPLTFIAGIYGMNFDRMPELHWQYGYYAALGLMLIIFIGMLIFFKRKGWL